jgi:hypothetical protein
MGLAVVMSQILSLLVVGVPSRPAAPIPAGILSGNLGHPAVAAPHGQVCQIARRSRGC